MAYKIRLEAKNEGLLYVDENGTYRFDVSLRKNTWTVFLPGSFGDSYEQRALTDLERERVLPRLITYLEKIKWLGLFVRSYSVKVVERT